MPPKWDILGPDEAIPNRTPGNENENCFRFRLRKIDKRRPSGATKTKTKLGSDVSQSLSCGTQQLNKKRIELLYLSRKCCKHILRDNNLLEPRRWASVQALDGIST
jgi:hypothetical protein